MTFGLYCTTIFQLTRSVGSVTSLFGNGTGALTISTHTLRGERDLPLHSLPHYFFISTHTLRGERDGVACRVVICLLISTHTLRGERDPLSLSHHDNQKISTHTLRGERDFTIRQWYRCINNFNSHAPWGA